MPWSDRLSGARHLMTWQDLDLRRRLNAAWRWPLYSPARFLGIITAAIIVIFVAPGWLSGTSSARDAAGNELTGAYTSPVPSATAPGAEALLDASASTQAPATTSSTTDIDRQNPATVAIAWMAAWCTQDPTGPANGNLLRAAPLMTADAEQQAAQTAPSPQSWARTQSAGLSTSCTSIQASVDNSAQTAGVEVVITATRQVTDQAGQIRSSQPMITTRRMEQDSSGKYLVAQEVTAG